MAKGDIVQVVYRTGTGITEVERVAEANGRSFNVEIEKDSGIQWLVVTEVTRGGTEVRKSKYRMEEVVAIHHDRVLRE